MDEKRVFKLSGYDHNNEAWCWRLVDASTIREGDIFRVKFGGMSADDLRDANGNYVWFATGNAKLESDAETSELNWCAKSRPVTENEMRSKCGLSHKAADGGIREGMPIA